MNSSSFLFLLLQALVLAFEDHCLACGRLDNQNSYTRGVHSKKSPSPAPQGKKGGGNASSASPSGRGGGKGKKGPMTGEGVGDQNQAA